jgi:hypothetical protein
MLTGLRGTVDNCSAGQSLERQLSIHLEALKTLSVQEEIQDGKKKEAD